MNKELQLFLSTELELNTDNVENIEVIRKKVDEINELKEQLEKLERTTKEMLFKEWKNNLDERFSFEESQKFNQTKDSLIKTGVILNYKGKPFSVLIEHNFKSTYIGIGRHYASDTLDPEIKEFIENIKKDESLKEEDTWWYGWKYSSFNYGYFDFENLLKLVMDKINSEK